MFSHDKLMWELQQDAVRAVKAAALMCPPAIAPRYVPLRISALFPAWLQGRPCLSYYIRGGSSIHEDAVTVPDLAAACLPRMLCSCDLTSSCESKNCLNLCFSRVSALAPGDVPALAPVQKLSGSLRLSLMQRAPNAVRDFAAASNTPWRWGPASEDSPTGASDGDRCKFGEEGLQNVRGDRSCSELDPDTASGTQVPLKVELVPAEGEGMDALGMLADAVASVPQSPPPKVQPKGIKQGPSTAVQQNKLGDKAGPHHVIALSAVSALAAIGSAAGGAAESAGADVEFTLRELQTLANELER